ncbi:hypothetical protein F4703DRAFT_1917743 [Phycomyces blakesleeanus]
MQRSHQQDSYSLSTLMSQPKEPVYPDASPKSRLQTTKASPPRTPLRHIILPDSRVPVFSPSASFSLQKSPETNPNFKANVRPKTNVAKEFARPSPLLNSSRPSTTDRTNTSTLTKTTSTTTPPITTPPTPTSATSATCTTPWTRKEWEDLERWYVLTDRDIEQASRGFYRHYSLLPTEQLQINGKTKQGTRELWPLKDVQWRCRCLDTNARFRYGKLPSERVIRTVDKKRKRELDNNDNDNNDDDDDSNNDNAHNSSKNNRYINKNNTIGNNQTPSQSPSQTPRIKPSKASPTTGTEKAEKKRPKLAATRQSSSFMDWISETLFS